MRLYKVLILLFLCGKISAQGQYQFKYIDLGYSDSLIRLRHPDLKLSDSYYVFLYPTMGAATTFAPPVIKELDVLMSKGVRHCNEDILFVFKNQGGLPVRLIPQLIKKEFLLDDKLAKQIKYIVDDSLYNALDLNSQLEKMLYIYRSKLVYRAAGKLHTIYQQPIPHSRFELDTLHSVLLKNIDSILLMERDYMYRFAPGKILIQGDVNDLLFSLDTRTGRVEKSFTLQHEDPTDFYCKYFAKSDIAKCNFAKSWALYVKKLNRQSLNISNVVYAPPYIYVEVSVEAYERNEKKFSQYDAEAKKNTIKRSEPILTAHAVMAKLDTNLKIIKIIQEEDGPNKGKKETFWMFDVGFFVNKQNKLVTQSFIDPTPRYKTPALAYFDFGDTLLKMNCNSQGKISHRQLLKSGFNNLKTYYFNFYGADYYCTDIFGEIHEQWSGKVASVLKGDGTKPFKKEQYNRFADQSKPVKVNYSVQDIAPIYNGRYLAAIYKYKGKPLLEIKDSTLQTIDVIDLAKFTGLKSYFNNPILENLLIEDDTIYFIQLKNDQYYLESYKINQICGQ